jgi:hypothetical protein
VRPYLPQIVLRQSERGVCRQPGPVLAGETHKRVETALPGVRDSVLLSSSLRSPDDSLTQPLASGFVMVCEDFYEYVAPLRMIWGRLSRRIEKT